MLSIQTAGSSSPLSHPWLTHSSSVIVPPLESSPLTMMPALPPLSGLESLRSGQVQQFTRLLTCSRISRISSQLLRLLSHQRRMLLADLTEDLSSGTTSVRTTSLIKHEHLTSISFTLIGSRHPTRSRRPSQWTWSRSTQSPQQEAQEQLHSLWVCLPLWSSPSYYSSEKLYQVNNISFLL